MASKTPSRRRATRVRPKSVEDDVILALKRWERGDKEAVGLLINSCDDTRLGMLAALTLARVLLRRQRNPVAFLDAVQELWREERAQHGEEWEPDEPDQLPASDTEKARTFLRYALRNGEWHKFNDLLEYALEDKSKKMWAWQRDKEEVLAKTLKNASQHIGKELDRRGSGATTEWRLRKASR